MEQLPPLYLKNQPNMKVVITLTMLAKVIFYRSKTLFSPCSLHHGTTFKGGENIFFT